MSSFFLHYVLDFVSVFIHFTIYAASSSFHMATAIYVSAIIYDMMSIMQRCDIIFTNNSATREIHINKTLNKTVTIHMDILE